MAKLNLRIAAPVATVVALILGVGGWLAYTAVADEKACTESTPATAYTVTSKTGPYVLTLKARGKQYHAIITVEGSSYFTESIFDGEGTEYNRDEIDAEWVATPNDGEFGDFDTFPFNAGSLCPDLSGTEYVGEGQAGGASASHYRAIADGASGSSGDESRGWDLWVDRDGWLVQATRDYGEGVSPNVTVTSTGGTDPIVIPSAGTR